MKEFLLIYRNEPQNRPQSNPEELQSITKKMMDWIAGIAAQNKLSDKGNRLSASGKVVRSNNLITDGPYSEIKETVGGYSLVKANSYEEALEVVKGCPIIAIGGNVEIREINPL